MGSKADRRVARDRVATYHESCLTRLVAHVAAAVEDHRSGQVDVYNVDEVINQYHRAARELWKFCWADGTGTHIDVVADTIERLAVEDEAIDWWQRGAPRPHRDGRG